MQQIADWLQKLGLGQYAQRFAENDINFAILPHLTDQDLKELGITSLGHRRQLLLAIAEISGVQKVSSPPLSVTEAPAAPHDTAERRQVTVMFSDLVGSTALSARMDLEDLREIISAYQKCVAEIGLGVKDGLLRFLTITESRRVGMFTTAVYSDRRICCVCSVPCLASFRAPVPFAHARIDGV